MHVITRSLAVPFLLAVSTACGETPLEPVESIDSNGFAASVTPLPACTKTWINGAGGDWMDGANWLPPGTPFLNDVACLTMPGTYAIVMDTAPSFTSVVVGSSSANVTLTFTGLLTSYLGILDEVIIQDGSEFVFEGNGFLVYIGGAITNHGTLRVSEGCACDWAGSFVLHNSFATPIHRNYARLDLADAADIWLDPGITFENHGDITVNAVHPPSIRLESDASPSAARIEMHSGTLSGTQNLEGIGSLDRVLVADGTVRPGLPIGTLMASALVLGPRSALSFEIAGTDPGQHDMIEVAGEVRYGGTFAVSSIAPFIGGQCGQVVPLITDNATALRGTFSKLVGLVTGPVSEWRIDTPPNLLQLAGFNPIPNLFASPDSVTATEGGASGSYAVCLGRAAPTADVVVTTTRGSTQIEVAPAALTFTTSNWMLPQFVTAVAINDAVVEGNHADFVNHSITTTDPLYATAFLRAVDVLIVDNDAPASTSATAQEPRS